jgi:hypothetical protein
MIFACFVKLVDYGCNINTTGEKSGKEKGQ